MFLNFNKNIKKHFLRLWFNVLHGLVFLCAVLLLLVVCWTQGETHACWVHERTRNSHRTDSFAAVRRFSSIIKTIISFIQHLVCITLYHLVLTLVLRIVCLVFIVFIFIVFTFTFTFLQRSYTYVYPIYVTNLICPLEQLSRWTTNF